jgi:SM-20-related protein
MMQLETKVRMGDRLNGGWKTERAMSTDLERSDQAKTPVRGRLVPYLVLHDFLDEAAVAGLLDYALSRHSDFAPTTVVPGTVDSSTRVSIGLRELGGYRKVFKAKILELVPTLISRLHVSPFEASWLETELVAHGDGAFYKQHIDTQTDSHEDKQIRILSGVYYFNAEPKAFTGGALRLHAIGGKNGENFVDIEPVRNGLLVFPAWAPHEVLPVSCPSKRFIDSRFAINCWVCRKNAAAMEAR